MRSWAIASREISAMLAEKSFILIVLLELLLVSSSGLLSVGYVLLTSPESSTTLNDLSRLVYVGIVTQTPEDFSVELSRNKVHHTFYRSVDVAKKDFRQGLIDAIIIGDIDRGPPPSVIRVYLPDNSPKTALTKLALKKVFVSMEEDLRQDKLSAHAPGIELASYKIMNYKPQARYMEIYYIFTLPLLLFLPTVISGSLAIDSITQDLESKRMLNLILAPLKPAQIVFGKAIGSFALSIFQSVLWLSILSATFVSPKNHLWLMFLVGIYTVIFINAGSILALYLQKMRSSQILYTFFSMSAISLFSPFANLHPLLLYMSPSYMITRLAMGSPPLVFAGQFAILLTIAALTTLVVLFAAPRVSRL